MAIIIRKKAKAPTPEPLVAPEPPKPKQEPIRTAPTRQAPKHLFDGECRFVLGKSPNAIVAWWLIASYAYYHLDMPVISDDLYDQLAKEMLERWDEIEHPHKHLITRDHLRAGSLYDLAADDYPNITKGAASHLIMSAWGKSARLV